MATYSVQCDNCMATHERSPYEITDVIKTCEWCGNDVCPDCDQINGIHTDCHNSANEEANRDIGGDIVEE